MNTFKLLYCGCLVSLLGCAGTDSAAKRNANADEIRANSSKAYSELEGKNVQASSENQSQQSQQLQTVESSVSLSEMLQAHACPNADDLRG
jgi:hypothetical protein